MPRKFMFTKEIIITAALELTRESGISAVTARSLGAKLGSSSKPIFSLFKNMEDVQRAIINEANGLYHGYLAEAAESGKYSPYLAVGMAYIHFAKEEKELFKLLFMRDRSHEETIQDTEENKTVTALIQKDTGLDEENAATLNLEMWIFAHGIATMIATSYLTLTWDDEFISKTLTDGYQGLKCRHCGKNI